MRTLLGLNAQQLQPANGGKYNSNDAGDVERALTVLSMFDPSETNNSRKNARRHAGNLAAAKGINDPNRLICALANNDVRLHDGQVFGMASSTSTGSTDTMLDFIDTPIANSKIQTNTRNGQIQTKYPAFLVQAFLLQIGTGVGTAFDAATFNPINPNSATNPDLGVLNGLLYVEIDSSKLIEDAPVGMFWNSRGSYVYQMPNTYVYDNPFWLTRDNQLRVYINTAATIADTIYAKITFFGSYIEQVGSTA